jgi:DNA-binding NtrC family response regulator
MDQETPRLGLLQRHVVVVLDDEPSVLMALRRMFRPESFELRSTTWAQDVLEWVSRESVSLVISDQRMPETSGIATLRKVRALSPKTRCLMLTGYPSPELEQEAAAMGVRGVIAKPWDDMELKRTVRQLLRERELDTTSELSPPGE